MGVDLTLEQRTDIRDTIFGVCELRDFGRVIALGLIRHDKREEFRLSRTETQKLFDKLWEFYFRPTEGKDG